ncbi:hypothetical protein BASA60_002313 [Batrachochytrium salamandrivorans]|nr:hypothetical protein BASA60_002313 [Batrachochytrium salamandrivorans]
MASTIITTGTTITGTTITGTTITGTTITGTTTGTTTPYIMVEMPTTEPDIVKAFYDATDALMDITFNAVDPSMRTEAFRFILKASRQVSQLKLIAASTIPKYAASFPDLIEDAFNAQLDLCEDEDIQIRKESVRNIWIFCKESSQFASSITDALCQLLQAEHEEELNVIFGALKLLLKQHSKVALEAVFFQLLNGVAVVRTSILQFMAVSLESLQLTPDLESEFINTLIKMMETQSLDAVDTEVSLRLLKLLKASLINSWFPDLISHANRNLSLYSCGASSQAFLQILFTELLDNAKFTHMELGQQLNLFKLSADLSAYIRSAQFSTIAMTVAEGVFNYLISDLTLSTGQPKIDLIRCEPVLYLLYVCDQISSHSLVVSESLLARLRHLYTEAQTVKSDVSNQIAARGTKPQSLVSVGPVDLEYAKTGARLTKILRAASNVYIMVKELLKPAHARQAVSVLLSWKPMPLPSVATTSSTTTPVSGLNPASKRSHATSSSHMLDLPVAAGPAVPPHTVKRVKQDKSLKQSTPHSQLLTKAAGKATTHVKLLKPHHSHQNRVATKDGALQTKQFAKLQHAQTKPNSGTKHNTTDLADGSRSQLSHRGRKQFLHNRSRKSGVSAAGSAALASAAHPPTTKTASDQQPKAKGIHQSHRHLKLVD